MAHGPSSTICHEMAEETEMWKNVNVGTEPTRGSCLLSILVQMGVRDSPQMQQTGIKLWGLQKGGPPRLPSSSSSRCCCCYRHFRGGTAVRPRPDLGWWCWSL